MSCFAKEPISATGETTTTKYLHPNHKRVLLSDNLDSVQVQAQRKREVATGHAGQDIENAGLGCRLAISIHNLDQVLPGDLDILVFAEEVAGLEDIVGGVEGVGEWEAGSLGGHVQCEHALEGQLIVLCLA